MVEIWTPTGKSDRNSIGYGSLERPSKHGDLLAWTDMKNAENRFIEEPSYSDESSNNFPIFKPSGQEIKTGQQFGQGDGPMNKNEARNMYENVDLQSQPAEPQHHRSNSGQ